MKLHKNVIDLIARRFQVLGDPCRLRILQALQGGALTVGQIVDEIEGNQPNISKHLQILFDTGLVGRRRAGNSIYYSIADPFVFRLCELVCRSAARRGASLQRYALPPRNVSRNRENRRSSMGRLTQGAN